jgi:SsrA-binding protein
MGYYKQVANNKKAYHDYFIEDKFEAGIALTGTEVKSVRMGKVSIKESHAEIKGAEAFVVSMHISPYEMGNRYNVDPLRRRKLLLHKKEIARLLGYIKQKGYTLVPLSVYINERGLVKVQIGVGRGKKSYDKRETIAKKDAEMRMRKEMSHRGR